MTPAERAKSDPTFSFLVKHFYALYEQNSGSGAGITPSEIREASGYAWQLYAERHPAPLLLKENLGRAKRRLVVECKLVSNDNERQQEMARHISRVEALEAERNEIEAELEDLEEKHE